MKKHPAWQEEAKHFRQTLDLIDREIKKMENETGVGAGEEKLVVVPGDLAVHERVAMDLMKRKVSAMHQLVLASKKPYFARLNFLPQTGEQERYYLGRWGVMDSEKMEVSVVDWRSPAANLYYSGQIGQVSYQAPDGNITGELLLKRMFTITQGTLENILDVGIVGQEAYLQQILGQGTSNRLKDVVTTIQAEQNIVIRHNPYTPLMVQGVAGSGKTTIALHRIAWLLYAYQKEMKPSQMMIVAPNPLFLDYISQVLPDLGVEEVVQTTFEDLCRTWLGKKMPKIQKNLRIEERMTLGEEAYAVKEKVICQKGSLRFLKEIEAFLVTWEKGLLPKENLYFGKHLLFSLEEMEDILYVQLKHFAWSQRIKEFQKMYKNRLETIEKKMIKWLQKYSDERLERFLTIEEEQERQRRVRKLLQSRDERVAQVQEEKIKRLKYFDNLWPDFDLTAIYYEFLSFLNEKETYRQLVEETQRNINRKKLYLEDLPPLVEIGRRILPLGSTDIRHTVVDEAQDFSPFMMHLLQKHSGNDSFTLVGDVLQGIYGAQGIGDWQSFNTGNFHCQGQICYLATSYRSTREIMQLAKRVLTNSGLLGKTAFQAVPRQGEEPQMTRAQGWEKIQQIAYTIKDWEEKGYKNIALICKTDGEAKKIYKQLKSHLSVNLLRPEQTLYQGGVVVISLAMAKGLEFDGVIIPSADKEAFPNEPFYAKLFYVACTRALHQLKIFYDGEVTLLLA